jgi:hypothetical protein
MAVSIYHKMKTGQTTRSRTSLSAVTNLAQLSFAFDYADVRWPIAASAGIYNALSHFYKTSEGLALSRFKPAEVAQLERIEAWPGCCSNVGEFLKTALQAAPAAYWAELLRLLILPPQNRCLSKPCASCTAVKGWHGRYRPGQRRLLRSAGTRWPLPDPDRPGDPPE